MRGTSIVAELGGQFISHRWPPFGGNFVSVVPCVLATSVIKKLVYPKKSFSFRCMENKGARHSRFSYYMVPTVIQAVGGFFIVIPISTYYLEVGDFGLYAVLASSVSFFGIFASPATNYVLNKRFFDVSGLDRPRVIGSLLAVELAIKSAFLGLGLLVASGLAFLSLEGLGGEKISAFVCLSVISFALSFAWPLTSLILILDNQPRKHFFHECVRVASSLASPVVLLVGFGLGEVSLYLTAIIMQLVSLPFEIRTIKKYCDLTLDWSVVREVLQEWRHSLGAGLVESGYDALERWFYALTLSLSSLGLYTHAQSYLNILKLLNKGISRSFASSLFNKFSSGVRHLEDEEMNSFRRICIGFFLVGLIVLALAPIIIGFITHGKFTESGDLVKIMYLVSFGFIPSAIAQYFLMSTGRAHGVSKATVFGKIIGISIVYPLVTAFGISGAAMAGLMSFYLPAAIMIIYSYRHGLNISFIVFPLISIFLYCSSMLFLG